MAQEIAVGLLVLVDADAEHHHARLAPSAAGTALSDGSFLDAGRAPGGPEIQHQQLAAEVRRRDGAAVVGRDGEIRRGVADVDDSFAKRVEDHADEHDASSKHDQRSLDDAFES